MNRSRMTLTVMTLLVAACSSPPKPPTVDDSKKRPVNVSQAVNLQSCRTELTATKIVLTETFAAQQNSQVIAALAQATARSTTTTARPAAAPAPNQVFVLNFPLGSSELSVPLEQRSRLLEQARLAKFILIRGRTDAMADSMSETRLAQRRAEAAYRYLLDAVRLPQEGIRLSWQGAGDSMQAGSSPFDRQANRRVEIEMYQVKPETHVLTLPDASRQTGA